MSEKKPTGGPAFPTVMCDEASLSNGASYTDDPGMTLRDYFAAKVIQGLLANPNYNTDNANELPDTAYAVADAMIAARKQ